MRRWAVLFSEKYDKDEELRTCLEVMCKPTPISEVLMTRASRLSLLFSLILLASSASSQVESLYRSDRPIGVKLGFEGLGVDLCLGELVGLDATTWLFYNAAKARIFLLNRNASPFVGFGYGSSGGVGGNSDNWTVVLGGWEHSYKRFFIQIMAEYAVRKQYKSPFPVNLNLGMRL